jgi:hypothetical protein
MPLMWDVTKCEKTEDFDATSEDEWEISQALIFHLMVLGYSGIKESNWKNVYARMLMYQRMFDHENVWIESEMIRKRIGLETNCNNESDAKWRKRMCDNFVRETKGKINE